MTTTFDFLEKIAEAFGYDSGYDVELELKEMGITMRQGTIYVHHIHIVTGKSLTTKVTPEAVIRYYATDARNISSGCRTLAGIIGDWRPIDNLAKQCLEIYKVIKRDILVRIAKSYDMQPKGW